MQLQLEENRVAEIGPVDILDGSDNNKLNLCSFKSSNTFRVH